MTEVREEEKLTGAERLQAEAEELGVLICQVPLKQGPNAGKSAQGTLTGMTRHRMVGHSAEEIDQECLDFRARYVRGWRAITEDRERRVVARLSDGTELVRYETQKKWFLEKDDSRQKVSVDQAVAAAKADDEAEIYLGVPGAGSFDKEFE